MISDSCHAPLVAGTSLLVLCQLAGLKDIKFLKLLQSPGDSISRSPGDSISWSPGDCIVESRRLSDSWSPGDSLMKSRRRYRRVQEILLMESRRVYETLSRGIQETLSHGVLETLS